MPTKISHLLIGAIYHPKANNIEMNDYLLSSRYSSQIAFLLRKSFVRWHIWFYHRPTCSSSSKYITQSARTASPIGFSVTSVNCFVNWCGCFQRFYQRGIFSTDLEVRRSGTNPKVHWVDWKCRTWKWRTKLQDVKLKSKRLLLFCTCTDVVGKQSQIF